MAPTRRNGLETLTSNDSRRSVALPYLALLGALLALPTGTSFAKQLFPVVGAEGTSLYRVGFSALFLWLVWKPWKRVWSRKELADVAAYGAILGAMNLSFYMSLRTLPLGIAIAVEFLGPLSLALIHSRKLVHFLWVLLASAGLFLLLPLRDSETSLHPVGLAFAGAAGLFWALYIVYGQRASYLPAGQTVALGMTAATCVIAPFGLAVGGAALLTPKFLGLGVIAALLSSTLPYSLEMIALRRIPKRVFGVLLAAEPALGAVVGTLLLNELLSSTQWLAIGLIVVAGVGSILTGQEG